MPVWCEMDTCGLGLFRLSTVVIDNMHGLQHLVLPNKPLVACQVLCMLSEHTQSIHMYAQSIHMFAVCMSACRKGNGRLQKL